MDKIIILVISGRGQGVVSKNVQTRKPVLKLCLQCVIAIVSVVAEIINTLSPAETTEERLADYSQDLVLLQVGSGYTQGHHRQRREFLCFPHNSRRKRYCLRVDVERLRSRHQALEVAL